MSQLRNIFKVAIVVALVCPIIANAGVRILDFDYDSNGVAIGDGQIIDNEYSAWGVNVLGCNINGSLASGTDQTTGTCGSGDVDQMQIAFNTLNSSSQDNDLEFRDRGSDRYTTVEGSQSDYNPLSNYASYYDDLYDDAREDSWKSPGNVMIIHENPGSCSTSSCSNPDDEATRAAGFFVFDFTSAVDILSLDFFDIEVEEAQRTAPDAKLFFFLANGSTVERDVPSTGNGNYTREMYTGLFDVTKMIVNMPGSGAINNLVYRQDETSTVDVSAPSLFGLFMIAIGGVFYSRSKKTR